MPHEDTVQLRTFEVIIRRHSPTSHPKIANLNRPYYPTTLLSCYPAILLLHQSPPHSTLHPPDSGLTIPQHMAAKPVKASPPLPATIPNIIIPRLSAVYSFIYFGCRSMVSGGYAKWGIGVEYRGRREWMLGRLGRAVQGTWLILR